MKAMLGKAFQHFCLSAILAHIDIQEIILHQVRIHIGRQRQYTIDLNLELATSLKSQGMVFNMVDTKPFRQRLAGTFYQRWKAELGSEVWGLLEAQVGKLAE